MTVHLTPAADPGVPPVVILPPPDVAAWWGADAPVPAAAAWVTDARAEVIPPSGCSRAFPRGRVAVPVAALPAPPAAVARLLGAAVPVPAFGRPPGWLVLVDVAVHPGRGDVPPVLHLDLLPDPNALEPGSCGFVVVTDPGRLAVGPPPLWPPAPADGPRSAVFLVAPGDGGGGGRPAVPSELARALWRAVDAAVPASRA